MSSPGAMSIDGGSAVLVLLSGRISPPRFRPRRRERRRRRPNGCSPPPPPDRAVGMASLPGSGPGPLPCGACCCGAPPSPGARRLRRRRLRGVRSSGVMRTQNRMSFSPADSQEHDDRWAENSLSKRPAEASQSDRRTRCGRSIRQVVGKCKRKGRPVAEPPSGRERFGAATGRTGDSATRCRLQFALSTPS